MSDRIDARLRALGLELPPLSRPVGTYVGARQAGSLLYVSGHGPVGASGVVRGKVGSDLSLEAARDAARLTGLSILATVRHVLGSLDRVRQVVKVFGMVNCAPGFTDTPAVIDGCSDLFVSVFGEAGQHARSAIGVAELPFNIAVEIEAVLEVA